MYSARNLDPLAPAIAGGTAVRIGGSPTIQRLPGMAHRTASFRFNRGSMR